MRKLWLRIRSRRRAKQFAKEWGYNLRRPFSFGVPAWRLDWIANNMNRLVRLASGRAPFKSM